MFMRYYWTHDAMTLGPTPADLFPDPTHALFFTLNLHPALPLTSEVEIIS